MNRWSIGITLGLSLSAASAAASPTYPGEVKSHLVLPSTPACGLCHSNGVTGIGTVNTPFGKSLRADGAAAEDVGSLDKALDALKGAKTDSDGDGVDDIAELEAGTDPNVAGGEAAPELGYGCQARVAPGPDDVTGGAIAAALVGAALFVARRRR